MSSGLSIIIPAHNEAGLIGACLGALVAASDVSGAVQVIVAANGCTDQTVAEAEQSRGALAQRGWQFDVLDLPVGGKPGALNAADAAALHDARIYLDADVTVSPALLAQLQQALAAPGVVYASGQVKIIGGPGWVSRAYARLWRRVPFMRAGVPGCGLFAVNAAGRARWAAFPQIIADDTYVRLQFAPDERIGLPASYNWPIAPSFAALVRVRQRQDAGVREVAQKYPALMANEDKPGPDAGGLLRLAAPDPIGFAVYSAVAVATRLRRSSGGWSRSR
ncbi:MAG: glycosyltransferase [Rhodobacteraceae bacterium]|nr:glycosyltransferase [Paracoccaceae bacterium]